MPVQKGNWYTALPTRLPGFIHQGTWTLEKNTKKYSPNCQKCDSPEPWWEKLEFERFQYLSKYSKLSFSHLYQMVLFSKATVLLPAERINPFPPYWLGILGIGVLLQNTDLGKKIMRIGTRSWKILAIRICKIPQAERICFSQDFLGSFQDSSVKDFTSIFCCKELRVTQECHILQLLLA